MTHKLTQKLLERKKNGTKADITDIARKVSQTMSLNNGSIERASRSRLNTEGNIGSRAEHNMLSDEEDSEAQKKQRRMENAGPPSFYEADIERYKRKFDGSIKLRHQFKSRMKDAMNFTDSDWNQNVQITEYNTFSQDASADGLTMGGRHRRSKQMFKSSGGTCYSTLSIAQPPSKSPIRDMQQNQTFLNKEKK